MTGILQKFSQRKKGSRKGFTLMEVLIASVIFTIVGLIGVTVFVNLIRIQRRVGLENAIYEDARFLMERISREIRENAVDYEEYYNKLVEGQNYGTGYGCYATRFYAPGTDDFGVQCSSGIPNDPNCIVIDSTVDSNTGKNPFVGNSFNAADTTANAFCDKNFASQLDPNCGDVLQIDYHLQNELYLIDPKGTEKTLLATKTILVDNTPVKTVGLLRLTGEDDDQDGIVQRWKGCGGDATSFCCSIDFDCDLIKVGASLESTRDVLGIDWKNYVGFIPISPSRTEIQSLIFFVAPLEDPRKAFAETTPEVQQQPHVTMVLTVAPSALSLQNYSGDVPTITLQTTITSRVYNEVVSFYGQSVCSTGY